MPSDPVLLAFDTSAAHCAAALLCGGAWTVRAEEMKRGQAERLMPLLEEVLAARSLLWTDLTRIGVGIGPGNFTGIRISVAAARGLALALNVPAIGVSTLDALQHQGGTAHSAVPGPRGTAYWSTGRAAPQIIEIEAVPASATWLGAPEALARAIAECALTAPSDGPPPAPLYVRAADAAPPRDAPPRVLDDA